MRTRFIFLFVALLQPLSVLARPQISDIHGENLITGNKISHLSLLAGKKGLVVIFMSAKCPVSHSHVTEIKSLSNQYPDFEFIAIHSNQDEPKGISKSYFKTLGLPFAVIEDENMKLADTFQAFKTPHGFLMNSQGDILYRGGITNSTNPTKSDQHFLRDALESILSGKDVSVKEGRTLGCVILRKADQNVW